MGPVQIPFGVMAYQSRSLPWAAQRCVNWYAETAPPQAKTKTPVILLPRPGLTAFSTISGACRGHLQSGGLEYAVFGGQFYTVDSAGLAVTRGAISGSGPVSIASNGLQITIVSEPFAWVYTISTATLTRITSASFPGSSFVTQIGGYFVHVVPGTNGTFFLSNLLDGLTFNALNFATAEMDSDALLASYGDHGELWLFGANTIEPWGVTGNSDFPMSPIQSAKIQRGCAAKFSIARQDNALFWIGDDYVVYRANGYTPLPVSTRPIEKILSDSSATIANTIGCAYTQDGHSFYQITLPGLWTLVYDNTTQLWAERQTFGSSHWKANYIIQCYGKLLAGHENGNIYTLSTGVFTDAGSTIRFESTSPAVHADTAKITISKLQIDCQTGVGLTTGQGSNPQIMLSWSDDGGATWSSEHWRTMGAIGARRTRAIWRRQGQTYSRLYKVAIADPVMPALIGAYVDMEIAA